ncbi:CidA/LrgA family protein [Pseudodonghicola flavimaris]|uniref:CidA/LrgA family protein n=1 Tax=Pseudodonghicola flavimaris TaxID=3050036 RepID=A0ABT7F2P5_9RHOB|nr:CidA/LrgA family protein [Pseudodonghicola flavimaris]MDK3018868.1 CidA/LrgA family protein [Pseudodonghicola flavimaris]
MKPQSPLLRATVPARRLIRRSRLLQIALVLAIWLLGEGLVRLSGLPLPGGLIGMALLLWLLLSGRLSVFSARRGADWFLADLLLFFVPAALAVVDHREFFGLIGVKILLVILLSTAAVMLVTGLTVELSLRWRQALGRAASSSR